MLQPGGVDGEGSVQLASVLWWEKRGWVSGDVQVWDAQGAENLWRVVLVPKLVRGFAQASVCQCVCEV